MIVNRVNAIGMLFICVVGLESQRAEAQGGYSRCDELPNPIFARGTTAVVPVLRRLGAKLNAWENKHTLVYKEEPACSAIKQYAKRSQDTEAVQSVDYFVEAENGKISTLKCNVSVNKSYDLVISDVFKTSCLYEAIDDFDLASLKIKEFIGPVQGIVPIVAKAYFSNNDIMSEELRSIYTCGAAGRVLTFTNDATIWQYRGDNGMRVLLAKFLGMPKPSVNDGSKSYDEGGGAADLTAESMLRGVSSTVNPDNTIAYSSTEVYDENRDLVKALKVKGPQQKRAYWPDLTDTSRDKINVREGRFMLQGALKLVTRVDDNGVVVSPAAKKLIDWIQGNPVSDPALELPFNVISIYAKSGVVPQCAMRVTRSNDDPIFKHFQPEKSCHCLFEMEATGVKSLAGCVACVDSTTCGAGKSCNYGYCE